MQLNLDTNKPWVELPSQLDRLDTADFEVWDRVTINYGVLGYWSSSAISLYVQRANMWNHNPEEKGLWKVEISHSSGGRDTKEIVNDIDAAQHFACALMAAAKRGMELTTPEMMAKLNAGYERMRARIDAEYRAEEAKRAAAKEQERQRVEADAVIGPRIAAEIMAVMLEDMSANGWDAASREIIARGTDRKIFIGVKRPNGKTIWYFDHERVSSARCVDLIAGASARSLELMPMNVTA